MKEDKTDLQVEDYNEMLETQAEIDGITKEELQQQMMQRMFTPQEQKILSMSEEQVRNEFTLIQGKKSNLSRRERDLVEGMFAKLDNPTVYNQDIP
tara:strand:- start:871 stop:1158 length:288 start_codon:yes stop_codon:yes gene_type:complete